MTEQKNDENWNEFVKLSDNRAYVEYNPKQQKEPYKSELFDSLAVKTLPLYLLIGAMLGLGIGIFFKTIAKKANQKKRKKQNNLKLIRPEFREQTKSERKHRQSQRKKYGIFDDDGNRL